MKKPDNVDDNKDDATINTTQTISDIIRGMQYAVNTAQDTLQKHQFEMLERYFNPETGEPFMRYVTLPDGRRVEVPVITLIPSNMLAIDELEMDFAVRVASSFVKKYAGKKDVAVGEFDTSEERSSFNVFFSGVSHTGKKRQGLFRKGRMADAEESSNNEDEDTDVVRIKMKFKAIEEPEAAARIREMLYTSVQ